MFRFYTRGMSFVDMAWLRKSELKNGALTYTRRKTGQRIRIRWEQCMQDIVDRHPAGRNGFLLPIIRESGGEREQYRRRQGEINHQLRNIARMAGADGGLTMYMARHSWASIAKAINIPLAVISDSMGHNSVRTTQIYLNSIDADVIDRANMAIISSVTAGEAKAQNTLTQTAGGQTANI